MEGMYFLVIWFGCAILHTLYELKLRPYLLNMRRKSSNRPLF